MVPGYKDTWGLALMKKGDKHAMKLEAMANNQVITEDTEFALKSSTFPGLGIIKGPKRGNDGDIILIGEENFIKFKIVNKGKDQVYLKVLG